MRSARVAASYSTEELEQQWAFLDTLVERQAASLRSGVQDPEEDEPIINVVAAPDDLLRELEALRQNARELESLRATVLELEVLRQKVRELEPLQADVRELDSLRQRVQLLEQERGELLRRLHEAELVRSETTQPRTHRSLVSRLRRHRH